MATVLNRMVICVVNVGQILIGFQIQNVSSVDIRFLQILIWAINHFVRIVRRVNVISILFGLRVCMMMFQKI